MKILLLCKHIHHKNLNFLEKCKTIKIDRVHRCQDKSFSNYDLVYINDQYIRASQYPTTKFLFGPQHGVFPKNLDFFKGPNSKYNLLSDWVVKCWNSVDSQQMKNLNVVTLPFGVETDKFINVNKISERNYVFVYFKQRNRTELEKLINFLNSKNIAFRLFDYGKHYREEEYLNYLQTSKYGIWLGRHESQGFALQEALSCDVPLLVWDVRFMSQEFGSNYANIEATAIPYWDKRCGESFYDFDDLHVKFDLFLSKLHTYKPREFVLENLSIEACEKKWIDLIKSY